MKISEQNRSIAQYTRTIIGGTPRIISFLDEKDEKCVDIYIAKDAPQAGTTTFVTIGFSDFDTGFNVDDKPLRVEIVLPLGSSYSEAGQILSTTCFEAVDTAANIYPGAIISDSIKMYELDTEMAHIFLTSPFVWDFTNQTFSDKIVTWLQAVPISDAERAYAVAKGTAALEAAFERAQIDVFDLFRKSAI